MSARWDVKKANDWYKKQPWLVGCNYIPSNAINQLEMFQKDTFDFETNHRELGWAQDLGMNSIRVYLHDLLWEDDAEGFKKTIDKFLNLAVKHKIKPLLVLFDDCWMPEPKLGKQPKPIPSVHNSGWMKSPGLKAVGDEKEWGRLEKYVKGVLKTFGKDDRIILWDLYNEPGNGPNRIKSFPLLKKTFEWAKEADPSQPITSGLYGPFRIKDPEYREQDNFQIEESDIITFHNYEDKNSLIEEISELEVYKRPLICTEYLARGAQSRFETCMPVFKNKKVGCYNWGLVSGKTNTIFPWKTEEGAPEPNPWHHDIFKKDGTPFDQKEIEFIKNITKL